MFLRVLIVTATISRAFCSSALGAVRCVNPLLAVRLGLPVSCESAEGAITIQEGQDSALELVVRGLDKPFRIDFCSAASRARQAVARGELVCKAVGRAERVIDLTAGLGRDSIMLASSGNFRKVIMVERNLVLFHLLNDALARFKASATSSVVPTLMYADSSMAGCLDELQSPEETAVYLDPMYPADAVGRRSLVKKETQVLHSLVADDDASEKTNNAALFANARLLATTRIVVKRPISSPPLDLDGTFPGHKVSGKTQRFDVYMIQRKT